MLRSEAINRLLSDEVVVEFTKTNGEYRRMRCTLREEAISQYQPKGEVKTKEEKPKANQSVWDVDANGWRSFLWSNVKTFDGVDTPNGIK